MQNFQDDGGAEAGARAPGSCCENARVVEKQRRVWLFCYSLPERRMAIIHQIPTTPAQL